MNLKKITMLLVILEISATAAASGIKVNPSKITLYVKTNEPATGKITISNPTSDVQIFKVYPDDFWNNIKTNPASFTLEAGAEKNVTVTVNIANDEKSSEILNTNISVVAKPLAEIQFQTNAGVKIPITINVSEKNSANRSFKLTFYITLFIVLFVILKTLFFLRQKNKSTPNLPV